MKKDVRWFGNAAHFICGHMCRFHLATQVGPYLVSTVGEMWPERNSREIHARIHDVTWHAENTHRRGDDYDFAYMQRFGYQEIGSGRTYETMVFLAGAPCSQEGCGCGIPSLASSELDFRGYNNAGDATTGHMELVAKWSRCRAPKATAEARS